MFLVSCTTTIKKESETESFSQNNHPSNIYLQKDVKASVDSLNLLHSYALNALTIGDSVGAQIYYEKIFSVISEFDEETKSVLLEWEAYSTLIRNINDEYEKIYGTNEFDLEAEEIRQELTNYEEEMFGDSSGISITNLDSVQGSNKIPLQLNNKVELALKYFQTKGRNVFTIWLERSGQYEQMIGDILKEYGLPENLVYIAMIESGFNPKAYSYARAAGLWQFISATGLYYGLRSDWWFDERRDPMLSSHAAAQHLKDLYDRFDDWYLAMAGYNCNPKKVEYWMRQKNTDDFWKLTRLPRQTRNYIPTFIAANMIAENPGKYGFHVEKLKPVEYDTVLISECVDLEVVSQCVDTTFEAIKNLNPAVMRWCTPPGVKNFTLNIPVGTREKFRQKYSEIPHSDKRSWVRHRVNSGETLSDIAKKYGSTISILKEYNKINGNMIYVGNYILVPVPQNKNYYTYQPPRIKTKSSPKSSYSYANVVPANHKKIIYIVKKGDTLGEIAEMYQTKASNIRGWNALYYGQHIYPNQKLTIWIPQIFTKNAGSNFRNSGDVSSDGSYHIVQSGDTLWDIAQKYDLSIENLKKLNQIRTNTIKPGERLRIKDNSGG
jgi:membrane-bound lytic murein transglycosylase D